MVSESFIQETIDVWSPYYGRELSREEAEEIIANFAAWVELMKDFARMRQLDKLPDLNDNC